VNFNEFEEFVLSEQCFNNHDVSYIDDDGLQHYLTCDSYFEYHPIVMHHLLMTNNTIKVEQMERHYGYINQTAHIFFNKKDGPTFDIHTDPVKVIIECLDGTKYMEVEGKEIELRPGEYVHIPPNTEHRALNYKKALMVSYGISDTETLDGIRENNGDMQS
jgi:mannose-6-phosphate isomerase-like protein (cupin superfamily)